MPTAHLTVLRYASLAVIGLLLLVAYEQRSFNAFLAALVVAWGAVFLLLTPAPGAKKRWVVLWGLSPYLLFAVGMVGWSLYSTSVIDPADLELIDLSLAAKPSGVELAGRVRNHSTHPLTGYSLEISLYDGPALIERRAVAVSTSKEVPPHEVGEFKRRVVVSSKLPEGFTWRYQITGTRSR